MPFSFTCPHCGSTTMVADQFAGQSGPCGSCGQTVTVGTPPLPPPSGVPTAEHTTAMRMLIPVDRSGWAIAAGYFGLFALLIFPAPLALLFGILGVRDVQKNEELHGMGRAIFGIVMGVLGTGLLMVGIVAAW